MYESSDTYIHVKATITAPKTAAAAAPTNNINKKVILQSCYPFATFRSKTNNAREDDGQYIDIVMPMYNLIEYSDAYSKTSGSLWKYYRDEPALHNNNNIIDFLANNNNRIYFKFKQ